MKGGTDQLDKFSWCGLTKFHTRPLRFSYKLTYIKPLSDWVRRTGKFRSKLCPGFKVSKGSVVTGRMEGRSFIDEGRGGGLCKFGSWTAVIVRLLNPAQ